MIVSGKKIEEVQHKFCPEPPPPLLNIPIKLLSQVKSPCCLWTAFNIYSPSKRESFDVTLPEVADSLVHRVTDNFQLFESASSS